MNEKPSPASGNKWQVKLNEAPHSFLRETQQTIQETINEQELILADVLMPEPVNTQSDFHRAIHKFYISHSYWKTFSRYSLSPTSPNNSGKLGLLVQLTLKVGSYLHS